MRGMEDLGGMEPWRGDIWRIQGWRVARCCHMSSTINSIVLP